MIKISKLLCMAICICIAFTMLLTGCTGPDTSSESTTGSQSTAGNTAAVETKPELEPYEVVWYYCGNGAEPNEKLVEDEIGKYLKDKINTTVDIVTFTIGEYAQKVQTIISSGEKADLVFSCSWLLTYLDSARNGMFVEITDDMLDKCAPHAKEVLAEKWLPGVKVDGKLYHLPCNKEVGAQGGMLLNKSLVEKYKFDLSTIKTYEDLTPMLQTIKDNEPGIYPLGTCAGDTCNQLIGCYGNWSGNYYYITMPLNGTKWISALEMPEVKNILKAAKKFNDAGFVRKDAVTVGDVTPDLKAGKVFATHAQLKPGKDAEMKNTTPDVQWVQVGLTDCVIRSNDVTGSMMAIPKTCEDPERVLMFYDYFYHDKNLLTLVNYGIENLHYVKVDDKTIDYAPATENRAELGWRPPHSLWMVGDQFKNYLLKSEDPNKYANLTNFNTKCKPFGDSLGFNFDPKPIQNTWDKLNAAQANEYTLLLLGVEDDVDAMAAKQLKIWNDAGLQEVLAEYNKQYEKFVAAKKK
ncbi:MAG: extracellular solute-binding protein [Clostridiaceae bacterium]